MWDQKAHPTATHHSCGEGKDRIVRIAHAAKGLACAHEHVEESNDGVSQLNHNGARGTREKKRKVERRKEKAEANPNAHKKNNGSDSGTFTEHCRCTPSACLGLPRGATRVRRSLSPSGHLRNHRVCAAGLEDAVLRHGCVSSAHGCTKHGSKGHKDKEAIAHLAGVDIIVGHCASIKAVRAGECNVRCAGEERQMRERKEKMKQEEKQAAR